MSLVIREIHEYCLPKECRNEKGKRRFNKKEQKEHEKREEKKALVMQLLTDKRTAHAMALQASNLEKEQKAYFGIRRSGRANRRLREIKFEIRKLVGPYSC